MNLFLLWKYAHLYRKKFPRDQRHVVDWWANSKKGRSIFDTTHIDRVVHKKTFIVHLKQWWTKNLRGIWVVIENATGLRFPNSTSPLSCSFWDNWISKRFTMSSARELVHLKHTKRNWQQDFLFLNLDTIFAYYSEDLLFKKMFSLNPGSS